MALIDCSDCHEADRQTFGTSRNKNLSEMRSKLLDVWAEYVVIPESLSRANCRARDAFEFPQYAE
jgi:hypothetical protein